MNLLFKKSKGLPNVLVLILIGALTVYGMYLRAKQRQNAEMWTDETEQVKVLNGSLYDVLRGAREIIQGPGDYLLVYPFYKIFKDNKWGLAIPHMIATVAAYYLLFILCRTYFLTSLGYLITFLIFSLNQTLIFHAFEIRPYSVLIGLGIAAFLVMRYVCRDPQFISSKQWAFCGLFIALTMLFHTYGALILFFCYIFHLGMSRKDISFAKCFILHLKRLGPYVLLALPLWYYLISADLSYMHCDTFEFIPGDPLSILKAVFGTLVGDKRLYVLLAGIFLPLFLPRGERWQQLAAFFVLILMPISLILYSCIVHHYWFVQRLYVWVMPLFAFLLGWCWDSLAAHVRGRVVSTRP